jgi:signal transduction histidine kinase
VDNSITVTEDWSKNWQAKIAVRITSIVLWSLTFFSMIFAGLLISQVKTNTEENQALIMDQLAFNIAKAFSANPHTDLNSFSQLTSPILEDNGIESVEITHKNKSVLFGITEKSTQSLTRELGNPYSIQVTANITPLEQTIRRKQIEIFMIFSISLVTLGAFLGFVIDKYVRQPFSLLENATQNFTSGNKQARVNISTKDEFGVLASFMNEMFDRITENEEQLNTEAKERKLAAQQVKEQRDALQQLTTELTIARDQAFEANHAKSAFLANMSHELRTPLNAIIGYSELLMDEAEDEKNIALIPDLGKIRQAGKHLLTLINDVLDISKIEAGKMELLLEDFKVAPMIDNVVNMINPMIENNNNTFDINIDNEIDFMHSDITRMKQILFNLLSNACKFTRNGNIKLIIKKPDSDHIDFNVIDSGIGIENDKIDRLFHEFVQADDSTTRKYGGTGLGLSICRRLIVLMGGNITVSSQVGNGSTFTATLPINVVINQKPENYV